MANPPLLHLDHAWKKFGRTVASNRRRLSRSMLKGSLFLNPGHDTLRRDEFWSLRDMSLTLRKGEAVGLIGRNGAGKSTLLRLLGGHMLPDKGRLSVNGRLSELINLTAGYQPLLSGRENIKFGAIIRGLSGKQARAIMDQVIEFSEIGDFIDAPFGAYSQGMKLRLAFSVAVHVSPEILLIDEVIGVGDYGFRQKCMAQLQSMRESCGIVMCTHNTGHLAKFCDRVIVLEAGEAVFEGDPSKAVAFYLDKFGAAAEPIIDEDTGEVIDLTGRGRELGPVHHDTALLPGLDTAWVNAEGEAVESFLPRQAVSLQISLEFSDQLCGEEVRAILFLYDEAAQPLARQAHTFTVPAEARQTLKVSMPPQALTRSKYRAVLRVVHERGSLFRNAIPNLVIDQKSDRWGQVKLEMNFEEMKSLEGTDL
ncbi:MAG: ABC transporter ATP-binding protein [Hyphomonadaceae bacterium]|nr:ABC transporter ATP-binding protein [Hyphomonadaceae bacterium]